MVKESRVLAEVEGEAEVPYEETRLARRARTARPRLAVLLLVGALLFAIEAAMARDAWMAILSGALVLLAWRVRAGGLGGIVGAALAAILGALVPLALMLAIDSDMGERIAMAFVVVWGLAMLPDVVTLLRDAELQHAYGRWARRDA